MISDANYGEIQSGMLRSFSGIQVRNMLIVLTFMCQLCFCLSLLLGTNVAGSGFVRMQGICLRENHAYTRQQGERQTEWRFELDVVDCVFSRKTAVRFRPGPKTTTVLRQTVNSAVYAGNLF